MYINLLDVVHVPLSYQPIGASHFLCRYDSDISNRSDKGSETFRTSQIESVLELQNTPSLQIKHSSQSAM